MTDDDSLLLLSRSIAAAQNQALRERTAPTTEERHRRLRRFRRQSSFRGRAVVVVAAAIACVAGAVWGLRRHAQRDLAFDVCQDRKPGVVGQWLATQDEKSTLTFSEGTQIQLQPFSSAHVITVHAEGALLMLEHGALYAAVAKRAQNDWRVQAGPFEVQSAGTSFEAAWDPLRAVFHVSVYDGEVHVKSGCLEGERLVSAGETLERTCPARGPSTAAL